MMLHLNRMAAILTAAVLIVSCRAEAPLRERIKVTTASGSTILKTLYVPVEGEFSSLLVQADAALEIDYREAVNAGGNWFRIKEIQPRSQGEYLISYEAEPRGNTLDIRTGTLSLVAPEENLGAFLNVRQGFEKVWSESFSGGVLSLTPGQEWTSPTLDGISSIRDSWLSFVARAESFPGASEYLSYPLIVTLSEGAVFAETDRASFVVDILQGDAFGSGSFHKLHIYNGGKVFSSETKLSFSVPGGDGPAIKIDDVCIYEIPVKSSGINGISEYDE